MPGPPKLLGGRTGKRRFHDVRAHNGSTRLRAPGLLRQVEAGPISTRKPTFPRGDFGFAQPAVQIGVSAWYRIKYDNRITG